MLRRGLKQLILFVVGISAMVFFGACGDGGVQLADKVKLTVDDQAQTVEIQIFMSDGVEVNMEGEIPIQQYGTIAFVPAGYDSPASIVIKGNYGNYTGNLPVEIGQARNLPNGGRFPVAVVPPLYFLAISQNPQIKPIFYFAGDKYVQVGVAVLIKAMSDKFPAGLVLSQNFRDKQGRAVAAVSIFGPKLDASNAVEVSGGLYFHGNFGDLSSQQNIPTDPIVIGGDPGTPANKAMAASLQKKNKLQTLQKSLSYSSTFLSFDNDLYDPLNTRPKTLFEAQQLETRVKKVLRSSR